VYALDEQVRRHEAGRASCGSSRSGSLCSSSIDEAGRCRGIIGARHPPPRGEAFPAVRGHARDRRPRHRLRAEHELAGEHRSAAGAAYHRARTTRTASSSRSTRPRSPAPTSSASSPSRSAARADGYGSRATGKRWYFLEDWYPAYGNLSRAILRSVPYSRSSSRWASASTASRWSTST
jgi:succinate dehydrogenase / fumarate reductase flavoprotein subunit